MTNQEFAKLLAHLIRNTQLDNEDEVGDSHSFIVVPLLRELGYTEETIDDLER